MHCTTGQAYAIDVRWGPNPAALYDKLMVPAGGSEEEGEGTRRPVREGGYPARQAAKGAKTGPKPRNPRDNAKQRLPTKHQHQTPTPNTYRPPPPTTYHQHHHHHHHHHYHYHYHNNYYYSNSS